MRVPINSPTLMFSQLFNFGKPGEHIIASLHDFNLHFSDYRWGWTSFHKHDDDFYFIFWNAYFDSIFVCYICYICHEGQEDQSLVPILPPFQYLNIRHGQNFTAYLASRLFTFKEVCLNSTIVMIIFRSKILQFYESIILIFCGLFIYLQNHGKINNGEIWSKMTVK